MCYVVMNYTKSRKKWSKYLCRKDKVNREWTYLKGAKKKIRKVSNQYVREYKGKISNGGNYKKIYDLWWTLF